MLSYAYSQLGVHMNLLLYYNGPLHQVLRLLDEQKCTLMCKYIVESNKLKSNLSGERMYTKEQLHNELNYQIEKSQN